MHLEAMQTQIEVKGEELDESLGRPPVEAALRLLRIALRELPQRIGEFPREAARAVEASIEADSR